MQTHALKNKTLKSKNKNNLIPKLKVSKFSSINTYINQKYTEMLRLFPPPLL